MMLRLIIILFTCLFLSNAHSQSKATSLDELVKQVKQERLKEKQALNQREQRFKAARNKQASLLSQIKQKYTKEETRGESLRAKYELNQTNINSLQSQLDNKAGSLDELHGIVRQISQDINNVIDGSIITAQKPQRAETLTKLIDSKELPSIQELEKLWLLTLDEMAESAKVVSYPTKVIRNTGEEAQVKVTRVGSFNTFAEGNYLRYLPETGKLVEPGRQPTPRYRSMARELETSTSGSHSIALDPTRGEMLALLVQVPNTMERIKQGGLVGYIIIAVGIIGLLISIERIISLTITGSKVRSQLKSKSAKNNPLGRILKVYKDNTNVDAETLEFKLDEAILKELPKLQRGMNILALLAAIAPLLGLLGTVTGIIETFQSITLFGTGDPRAMSDGISQALVTTVMGLVVAIPLLLLHSFIAGKSNGIVQTLDEKSKSFIAQLAELKQAKRARV